MSARILVVDDIEANRRLLKAKLEAKYYDVIVAENGRQAIDAAKSEGPAIILLDVMMPGLDGYETCRLLKADPDTAHIPVVMVTALSEVEDRIKGLDAGAEDFLTKPVDDFALMTRIETLMRYNTVADELRRREASGMASGSLEAVDLEDLKKPASILIIDDNQRSSARLAKRLREEDHTVVTLLESGGLSPEAGRKAELVIVSLNAERFDPLRICAHFKMHETTRSLSVIVIFDPHDQAKAIKAMELGASDMVARPIEDQELLARVRTQSRRTRYIDILRRRVDHGMELAVIDQLTGLHNRRYMINQLDRLLKRPTAEQSPISVMIADIDHFKKVNDTYGHEAGDHVLQEIARRLQANTRPTDIVCRHGGEEFMIIMPDTPVEIACKAAERIRKAVAADAFEIEGVPVSLDVTLSGGVAAYTGTGESALDLIKKSDEALYRAKSAGRNRVESVAA